MVRLRLKILAAWVCGVVLAHILSPIYDPIFGASILFTIGLLLMVPGTMLAFIWLATGDDEDEDRQEDL